MARYIDADKLIEHLKDEIKACEPSVGSRANGRSVAYGTKLGLQSAISFAETLATADVAQKSEVAREIFDEAIRAVYSKIDMKIYNTIEGKPLGDGVAFGKQQAMYDVITLLAELKKKAKAEEKE